MSCFFKKYEYIDDIVENLKINKTVKIGRISTSALGRLDHTKKTSLFEYDFYSKIYHYKYNFYSHGSLFNVDVYTNISITTISALPKSTKLIFSRVPVKK